MDRSIVDEIGVFCEVIDDSVEHFFFSLTSWHATNEPLTACVWNFVVSKETCRVEREGKLNKYDQIKETRVMFFEEKNFYYYIETEYVDTKIVRSVPWKITSFTIVFSLWVWGQLRILQKRQSVTTWWLFLMCSKLIETVYLSS